MFEQVAHLLVLGIFKFENDNGPENDGEAASVEIGKISKFKWI